MLRIIFDRSAFHGEDFEMLMKSKLEMLCKHNAVLVFHTPVFLDETLEMYGNEKSREEMRRQLPFILRIANGGFFRFTQEIWHDELVKNRGQQTRVLMNPKELAKFNRELQQGPMSDNNWLGWDLSRGERDEIRLKKETQRQTYAQVRRDISEFHREGKLSLKSSEHSFPTFLNSEIDRYGRAIIGGLKIGNSSVLQNQWSRNKERYPYVTAFAEGFVYASYYAAAKHNQPIDKNAEADFTHMSYLNHADVLVSADMRFLREAFAELWKPRHKTLFTPIEFVQFIEKL